MVVRSAAAAWTLVLAATAAAAQQMAPLPPQTPPARTLSWEDCVSLAALQNPSLVSAQFLVQAGRAAYHGSFNGLLPTLTLSNSYSSSEPGGAGKPSYGAQADASVSLFNLGQIAGIRSSAASYAQDRASLRQASASLRFSLRQAFAQAYFAELNIAVARQILDIQRRNADEVALRYDSGKEYKGNKMNAQAQVIQATTLLDQVLRAQRTSRRNLNQQLGLDDFSEVAVTGTLAAVPLASYPARMRDYVDGRPDVQLQEAVVGSARAALLSARAPLFPTLSASYARTRTGPTEFPGAQYGWDAGAVLSYPLFGGGPTSAYYAGKAAQASLSKADQDLRAVRNAGMIDLEASWAAYANALDQLQTAEAARAAARQRNDEGEIRYASGLLSYDNLEVIISEWVSAEQQMITAQQNAVTAEAAWERALGKGLGD